MIRLGALLPILLVYTALAVILLGQGVYAQSELPETEYSIEMKKVMKARLGQIALVVQQESGGKSRLLISSGEGAFPTAGRIARLVDWGDLPPAKAYRVSEPFDVDVEGMRQCRVIGALFLIQDADIVGGHHIMGGTYLLAYSPNAKRVLVVEVKLYSDGRMAYREVGRVALLNSDTSRGTDRPYVGVWFPTEELLTDDDPCNRVTIDLAWKHESYMFRVVDMNFIML